MIIKYFRNGVKLLVLLLLICVLCVGALAADYTLSVGGQESIPFGVMEEAGYTYELYGEVPGMALTRFRGALVLEGSPTRIGEYSVTLTIGAPDGSSRNVTMTVSVVAAPTSEPSVTEPPATNPTQPSADGPKVTKDPTNESIVEGDRAVFIARAENVRQFVWEVLTPDGKTIPCSELPLTMNGILVSGHDTEKLVLSNIPAAMDGCKIRCRFVGAEASSYSAYATVTVIARDAIPEITKDPTGETVNEGNLAQFVARADNAVEYQWMIQTPDDKSTYPCDSLSSVFPEVRVDGADTECLTIYNIPADMDGWKVYCIFSAPGGDVSSSRAVIFVNAKPTEATEPEPTETEPPTTEPPTQATTEPTTQPTTEPTTAPTTQPTEPHEPTEPEEKPAGKKGSFGTVLLVIMIAAFVIAVGAGAVIVYLRIRQRDEYDEYEEYEDEE